MVVALAKVAVIFAMVVGFVPVLIWMERKGAAYIQDRRGPNRASIMCVRAGGFLHSIADAIKLFSKEEVAVAAAFRPAYLAAPIIAFFVATVTVAVVPFSEPASFGGFPFSLQVADLKAGLVYVLAVSSLGVYAVMLAGWASGNKFSLLGAMRACAQTISYELAIGLAALALFMLAGSLSLSAIVEDQGFWPWRWNAVRQPLAFAIFFTAMLAEARRLPFDLPEGESEIVAGYHTEYSSMRFAMFFMGEYAHIAVGSMIMATLFLGGWQLPFCESGWITENFNLVLAVVWPGAALALIAVGAMLAKRFRRAYRDARDFEPLLFGALAAAAGLALLAALALGGGEEIPAWLPAAFLTALQTLTLLAKTLILCCAFIWVRWTLPRFRYDQLMHLGWKVLLPLAMINVVVTAVAVLMYGG